MNDTFYVSSALSVMKKTRVRKDRKERLHDREKIARPRWFAGPCSARDWSFFCGVDAILSESVTTPAMMGDGKRVQGMDTVFVGVGWILIGLGFTVKVLLSRRHVSAGTVVAVGFAALGGLFWLVAV